MTDNLSTLQRNVLLGLETERGKAAFLWASARRDADRRLYIAERYAHQVERLEALLMPWIDAAAALHKITVNEDQGADLLRFVLERHRNAYFGNAADKPGFQRPTIGELMRDFVDLAAQAVAERLLTRPEQEGEP